MKWIAICCLYLAVSATAYQVHEEPEENDETTRGKRQQTDVGVIDSIFNIPIQAIKQTSVAAQSFSPASAGTIDNVLKIPVTTLEAVSNLIKNRQQANRYSRETTPLSTSKPSQRPQRRYDQTTPQVNEAQRRRREEIKRRVEAQREQQRVWEEQLNRRRFEQMQQHNRRMQQQITQEDELKHHSFYRDPFGFNALTKWIVGPHGIFNGHAGHGDGHVYQYFNQKKPLHFGGHAQHGSGHHQGTHKPIPTRPPPSQGSTTTTSTTHNYEVHELVDEGVNPFAWPNWFGIINVLKSTAQTYTTTSADRPQHKILPTKITNVKFDEPPLQNKIAPKDEEYYASKYAKARNNYKGLEEELTGNEIDSDVVGSVENRLGTGEREGKVLFPSD